MSYTKILPIAGSTLVTALLLLLAATPSGAISAPILINGLQTFTNLGSNESLSCWPDCNLWRASIDTFDFNIDEDAEYTMDVSPDMSSMSSESSLYEPFFKLNTVSMGRLVELAGGELPYSGTTFGLSSGFHRIEFSFAGSFGVDESEIDGFQLFTRPVDADPLESFNYLLRLSSSPVPEPSALILLALGLAGLGLYQKQGIRWK